jgi:hypothetical protein
MEEKNSFTSKTPKRVISSDKALPAEAANEGTVKSEMIPSSGEDGEDVATADETVYPGGLKLLLLA